MQRQNSGCDHEVFGPEELVRRETKVVQVLRALLIALLIVVGAFLSFGSYKITSKWEEETYHNNFDDISMRFANLFLDSVSQAMWSGYAMAIAVTASSDLVHTKPNITISKLFNKLSTGAQRSSVLSRVFWAPYLRSEEDRLEWEAYAQEQLLNNATTSKKATEICNTCGDPNLEIGAPEAAATFPVGSYNCKDVEAAAEQGLISMAECPIVVPYIVEGCQCRPRKDLQSKNQEVQTISKPRSDRVFEINQQGDVISVQNTGPYLPIWQVFPSDDLNSFVYYDLYSDATSRRALEFMMVSKLPQISEISGSSPSSIWNTMVKSENSHLGGLSLLYTPVFDRGEGNGQFVGSIVFDMDWSYLLASNLPMQSHGIEIVMESSSGLKNTFRSNGVRIQWVGEGDLHDPAFSSVMRQTKFSDFLALQSYYTQLDESDISRQNTFRISIYSSKEFRAIFISSRPWFYASAVILIFVFTCVLFVAYDSYVTQRQRKIMMAALQRDEIVSSLFPAAVLGRLFRGGQAGRKRRSRRSNLFPVAHPKAQLRKMLSSPATSSSNRSISIPRTEPIADFFPNVTVVFADISGFTAWSSEREPSQVFKLLETVYQAFDKLAKRLGVFKIETIGDCYVAAAGLPVYQPDHAVRVVKFAYQCILRMRELTHELESSLGPSTSSLSIRIGVHSGPVIAGVLRGEKSRFQLFGDTMNTTSRMQTTGEINMIQISSVTANLLEEADKGHWIQKRDHAVTMKGKGLVQTFWADPLLAEDDKNDDDQSQMSAASCGDVSTEEVSRAWGDVRLSNKVFSKTADDKVKRLVEWNAVLLLRHLKMIAASRSMTRWRRNSMSGVSGSSHQPRRTSMSSLSSQPQQHRTSMSSLGSTQPRFAAVPTIDTLSSGEFSAVSMASATPLEEVSEILCMPGFSERVAREEVDPESIDLGDVVRAQLLDYVDTIASLYHDNPFHNFEHASHVVMSANKVVMRIIKPDLEDQENVANHKGRVALKRKVHESTFGISSDVLMQFAVVFSALIHDVDHPGVSNAQLVKESTDVALRYDKKCVAEQNSVDIAWNLLMQEQYRELLQCICSTEEEQNRFRQLLVNAVIATDIADKQLQLKRKIRWDKAFHNDSSESSCELTDNSKNDMDRKATIVFEYIIQASDVAHTMQHWKVYKKWNERLFEERYLSFITGREDHDPSVGWYQGELWFFDNYIIPLAKKLETCGVFGVSSDEYLSYALENRHEWETKGEEIVQHMVEKYNAMDEDTIIEDDSTIASVFRMV